MGIIYSNNLDRPSNIVNVTSAAANALLDTQRTWIHYEEETTTELYSTANLKWAISLSSKNLFINCECERTFAKLLKAISPIQRLYHSSRLLSIYKSTSSSILNPPWLPVFIVTYIWNPDLNYYQVSRYQKWIPSK